MAASSRQPDPDVIAIKTGVEVVRSKIDDMAESLQRNSMTVDQRQIVNESFKCAICHAAPITPLPIAAICCQRIVGCVVCVNEWYAGDTNGRKRCPLCNRDNGRANTLVLHGLDAFLQEMKHAGQEADQDVDQDVAQEVVEDVAVENDGEN